MQPCSSTEEGNSSTGSANTNTIQGLHCWPKASSVDNAGIVSSSQPDWICRLPSKPRKVLHPSAHPRTQLQHNTEDTCALADNAFDPNAAKLVVCSAHALWLLSLHSMPHAAVLFNRRRQLKHRLSQYEYNTRSALLAQSQLS